MTIEIKEAAVYVGTYAKYNAGSLEGKWLKFSDYSDAEEFMQACLDLHSDEEDPELMFQDFENFPKELYSESMSESECERIYELLDFVNASHLDYEAIEAGLYLGLDLENIEEAYSGHYNSDAEFAEDMADQLGYMDKEVKWPFTCIDWEWAAREIMYDYSEHNGHYFRQM